jgi:protein-arginine kinase activator protein McsA
MPKVELTRCEQCGMRYEKKKSWQKFCTSICRDNYHSSQREKALRIAKAYGLMQDSRSWQEFGKDRF